MINRENALNGDLSIFKIIIDPTEFFKFCMWGTNFGIQKFILASSLKNGYRKDLDMENLLSTIFI